MKKIYAVLILVIYLILLTSCDITLGSFIGSDNVNRYDGSNYITSESSVASLTNSPSSENELNSSSIDSSLSSCSVCETTSCEVCSVCQECEVCDSSQGVEDFQDLLIATRDEARNANIIIKVQFYTKFGPTYSLVASSTGSGVVYKHDTVNNYYYAISNFHVFSTTANYSKYDIDIETMSGSQSIAQMVHYNSDIDLAVIKFSSVGLTNVNVHDVTQRADQPLMEDEFVLAVGNPSSIEGNVTFGQYVRMTRIANVDYEVIHHTALIYSGNSGGALIDIYGKLVGINTWGSEDSPSNSYAIPLSKIIEFLTLNQLM